MWPSPTQLNPWLAQPLSASAQGGHVTSSGCGFTCAGSSTRWWSVSTTSRTTSSAGVDRKAPTSTSWTTSRRLSTRRATRCSPNARCPRRTSTTFSTARRRLLCTYVPCWPPPSPLWQSPISSLPTPYSVRPSVARPRSLPQSSRVPCLTVRQT